MNYIFCGSYEALFFALYLKSLGKKITIVTYSKNIIKYCKAEKIDYTKYNQIIITGSSFYKVFAFKQNLDKLIKKMNFGKKDKFFLTGRKKAIDAFYLAKRLSKKGTVYYYPSGVISENEKIYESTRYKSIFIRGEILKFIVKIFLDLDLMYYQGHGIPVIGVDDKFLKKHNIVKYVTDMTCEDIKLDAVIKYKSNYKEFDNIIIGQGSLKNIIKFDSLAEIYKNLSELIGEFAFKKHPIQSKGANGLYFIKLFKDCEDIPEWVPVELYFNNIKKNVISVYSVSLIIASQFSHLKAISLLELVEWYNESFKRDVKRLLIKKSGNKIFFPNSFDELKEIINEPRR